MNNLTEAFKVLQKEFNNKNPIGTKVRVIRKSWMNENGWPVMWSNAMNTYIGKIITIESYDKDYDGIIFEGFVFPFFILKVVQEKYEFKPFDQVLVKNSFTGKWIPAFYCKDDKHNWRNYQTIDGNNFAYCIPYKGNEHLVFTTNNE